MRISRDLSEIITSAQTPNEVEAWIQLVSAEIGGLSWLPVGGKENNIHTVEVSSNSGLALMERVTNGIDAMLDKEHLLRNESAKSPAEGAEKWYGVEDGDLCGITNKKGLELSENIVMRTLDSGVDGRPTVRIQDRGTGQHPDDWETTLLSLQESNKKSSIPPLWDGYATKRILEIISQKL